MLAHVATALTVAVLLVNLAGLSLAGTRLLRSYALARAGAPMLAAAVLFFVEHFLGLGSLAWATPFTTAAACWLLVRERAALRQNWQTEAAFLAGFLYALAWRFAYPDLAGSSEKLTDLGFILNYMPGHRLPPVDRWLPPFVFDVYYGFQFYSAALIGRFLNVSAGQAYQLAISVCTGLTVCAAFEAARLLGPARTESQGRWSLERWAPALVALALLVGGTGASPIARLFQTHPPLHASMRFIGGTATPEQAKLPVGKWVVEAAGIPAKDPLELPDETFAYLVALGDYHPPISGFLLLALAVLAIASAEMGVAPRAAQALLAATIPITAMSNAWNLPLQAGLPSAWILYRVLLRKRPDWFALSAGLASGALLVWPFLSRFGPRSADYATQWRLVSGNLHTPPLLGFLVLYPVLALIALALAGGWKWRFGFVLALFWLAVLVSTEVVFLDDIYGGKYERFNTSLKWWPWIAAGATLTLGPLNLAAGPRWRRWGTLAALALPGLFGVELAGAWVFSPKVSLGRLDGDAWLLRDRADRAVLEFLRAQPRCIVLQRILRGSFTDEPGLVMHAGQTPFLGWPEHERLWRGRRADIDVRQNEVAAFYRGELREPVRWLQMNQIEHVLWLKDETELPTGSFERVQRQIGGAYFWREFYFYDDVRVGVWSRQR